MLSTMYMLSDSGLGTNNNNNLHTKAEYSGSRLVYCVSCAYVGICAVDV